MGLKELLEQKKARVALLPEKNDYLLTAEGRELRRLLLNKVKVEELHLRIDGDQSKYLNLGALDTLDAYVPTLIGHDYTGKTPLMWNSVYEKHSLNIRSIMIISDPNDLQFILDALKKDPKYIGGGAGVGLKEKVIPLLDAIEPFDIKSVNIIVKEDGRLIGHNTDAKGLLRSLEEKLRSVGKEVSGQKFVVVGAGGVAQQFVRVLAEKDAGRIIIANRTFETAQKIAAELNKTYRNIAETVSENSVKEAVLLNSPAAIINTSDKGGSKYPKFSMFFGDDPNSEKISREAIREIHKKFPDMIYGDIIVGETPNSLKLLKEEGVDSKFMFDGDPMVIYQAVPAYKLIEQSYKSVHKKIVSEDELLSVFKGALSK